MARLTPAVRLLSFFALIPALSAATRADDGGGQIPSPTTGSTPAAAVAGKEAGKEAIGCVDLRFIATRSKSGQGAFARVTELGRKKTAEVESRAKALQEQQQKIQQDPGFLKENVRTQLERTFERARTEFDRFRQDAEAEVLGLQRQVEAEFSAKVLPLIDAVSKEKGLQLVFDIERASIVWWNPSADISDEIVKRLDAEP